MLGLGTWLSKDTACKEAVAEALRLGCRLIDTAALYENEELVGAAIRESGVPREELFVVTKLHSKAHPGALEALKASLGKLGLERVDLYLIHTPSGGKCLETWKSCLEARDQGLAVDVGVSNFGIAQLEGLRAGGLELPSVNQIELSAWNQQSDLRAFHSANGITTMGYCPLGRCKRFGETSAVNRVATRLGRSEANIALPVLRTARARRPARSHLPLCCMC